MLPDPRPAVLLSAYMTGAPQGRNLAALGYSYDFVARAFTPLLERWGRVIEVPFPERYLEAQVRRAGRGDLLPVHVAFRAFQHAWLSPSVPNIVRIAQGGGAGLGVSRRTRPRL